ncbi:MAG: ATP-binding protein [Gammaproteobacteria bacterium]|nr:ATP-binding protein [Gammaproteobacteria bacterium]MCW8910089.1 ATP-binding protein [Gammaproteobacteria bacterium]MCW9005449.1 ATP-binding protein [Gammaproteobacteria bacterium]MCW9057106.1 ATP-binding protein [Gammaproteobacteria bacterium]
MDITITDIMLHIDEDLDKDHRNQLETYMRGQEGIVSLGYHDKRPHLMMVGYNPECITSMDILTSVQTQGVHAELIGL